MKKFLFESLQNVTMVVGSESLTRFSPDAPFKIVIVGAGLAPALLTFRATARVAPTVVVAQRMM